MKDIYSLSPLNKQTAIVTGKGEHFTPKRIFTNTFDVPTFEYSVNATDSPAFNHACVSSANTIINYSGKKFPQMMVVGVLNSSPLRWILKCKCGRYELRKPRGMKKIDATTICGECEYLNKIKKS
jgi:hypothetical protein